MRTIVRFLFLRFPERLNFTFKFNVDTYLHVVESYLDIGVLRSEIFRAR